MPSGGETYRDMHCPGRVGSLFHAHSSDGSMLEDQGVNPGESQGVLPLCGDGPVLVPPKHIQLHPTAAGLKVSFAI